MQEDDNIEHEQILLALYWVDKEQVDEKKPAKIGAAQQRIVEIGELSSFYYIAELGTPIEK